MITIYLPNDISLVDLAGFAMARGYRLYSDPRGTVTFKKTQSNIGRVNMRRQHQPGVKS